MASEIEALPDRAGYLKFASRAAWTLVRFEYRSALKATGHVGCG